MEPLKYLPARFKLETPKHAASYKLEQNKKRVLLCGELVSFEKNKQKQTT